jgi:hypothetical protein
MTLVHSQPVEQLSQLFGNYRAEWLRERIFDLFTTPAYFPELETRSPCVLMGGRGTGKTTVLRSLSYEGRAALFEKEGVPASDWDYYGLYYRVDTNRVTAFQGPELSEQTWTKLFGHYVNLLLCSQMIRFLNWYALRFPDQPMLSPKACELVALSLRLEPAKTINEFTEQLENTRLRFEAFLNNLSAKDLPPVSMQAAPVDELLSAVVQLPQFAKKHFFFLIDEFENFTDPQQIVMNTFIKHCGANHSFKIGVRELGWRKRSTLNPNEQLNSPADYIRINISEKLDGDKFSDFASQICNQRLSQLRLDNNIVPLTIQNLLPGLSEEEEAECLGLPELLSQKLRSQGKDISDFEKEGLSSLELYLAVLWAEWNDLALEQVLKERVENLKQWRTRLANYRHALLFTIKKGKAGIRKYYSGWSTFVQLSGSNIRYLLELVDRTLVYHYEKGGELGARVSCEHQTVSAQNVGAKNVSELEGLSVHGAQLTKLVLGLGRVFQVLASHPAGHSPEQNQFHVTEQGVPPQELTDLLSSAVMHLALVRSSGTKLADDADVKAYDYSLHPIFAPFFVFSYRKKRKIALSPERILGLVKESRATIREILKDYEAEQASPLPEQLRLFEKYYDRIA